MYQIKLLKTLALQPTQLFQRQRPNDLTHEATATLTITNDLGEQFFYGDVPVTAEVRQYTTHSPQTLDKNFKVISETTEHWIRGKRALDVKAGLKWKDVKMGGYISMFLYVKKDAKVEDGMNYGDITTEELIEDTFEGLDTTIFRACGRVEYFRVDGFRFLPILTDLLEVPTKWNDVASVRTDRVSIRSVNGVLLYEELSGQIARHLWDAGVHVNALQADDIYKFMSLTDKPVKNTSKFDIIELGTGIGLASIYLSKLFPKSTILATDLEDAEEICNNNIKLNGSQRIVKFSELDWDSPDKTPKNWDYIVVTDCIYNPIYFDALINVMTRECGPKTIVFLVQKFRHPYSESEFYAKLNKSELVMKKQQWHSEGQVLIHMGLYMRKG